MQSFLRNTVPIGSLPTSVRYVEDIQAVQAAARAKTMPDQDLVLYLSTVSNSLWPMAEITKAILTYCIMPLHLHLAHFVGLQLIPLLRLNECAKPDIECDHHTLASNTLDP